MGFSLGVLVRDGGRAARAPGHPGAVFVTRGPRPRQQAVLGYRGAPAGEPLSRGHVLLECSADDLRPPATSCQDVDVEKKRVSRYNSVRPALLALPGCGVLSAGKIVGEVAGGSRFCSPAAFARWGRGGAHPGASGKTDRQRLNRGGNRQVNAALHRIGVTQWRGVGTIGRAYVERRMAPATARPRRSGCCAGACPTKSSAGFWSTRRSSRRTQSPPNGPRSRRPSVRP